MTQIIIDFIMNNKIEVVIISVIAYIIAGRIMRALLRYLDIWLGKRGGRLLWLIIAISISAIYHKIS